MPAATGQTEPEADRTGRATPREATDPLTILIVDDTRTNLLLLDAILTQEGHRVVQAQNGLEAVARFEQARPDLIVMDVMMPVLDGYEATRLIKARCGDRFVPVIFLTAITDEAQLAACVEKGGDDFLTKPIHKKIFLAKVNALNRVRLMHQLVHAQKSELAALNAHLCHEQEIAKQIYDRVMQSDAIGSPEVRHRLSPAAIMSGDLLLVAAKPTGALCALLGDFTGHGLAAAAGALPVAETFYAMIGKGFAIDAIAAEINRKLRAILPTGIFCAACLVEMSQTEQTLTVWNGGIPEGLLYRPGLGLRHRLRSRHLPLGLLDHDAFDPQLERFDLADGDRLYLYSDGVIEALDETGTMFGREGLETCLAQEGEPGGRFEALHRALASFCGGQPQQDDMAILELTYKFSNGQTKSTHSPAPKHTRRSTAWRVDLELAADALKTIDPLPQLTRLLADFESLPGEKEPIFMTLAELLSNAIDHGLLGLDSSLKADPDGFSLYYEQRTQRLAGLAEGRLKVQLEQVPLETGGQLIVRIEDSGPGFDHEKVARDLAANQGLCGRGIPLVRSLCPTVTYFGCGNRVEAVYTWT